LPNYQLYQNLDGPADFTVVEEWASATVIDSHMATGQVKDAFARRGRCARRRPKSKDAASLDNCE
jgi:quinol monooxygenase YgiN